jgi:hypothetical protein
LFHRFVGGQNNNVSRKNTSNLCGTDIKPLLFVKTTVWFMFCGLQGVSSPFGLVASAPSKTFDYKN